MYIKFSAILFSITGFWASAHAQSQYSCTGPDLTDLLNIDLSTLESKELNPSFARNTPQFKIKAFYHGSDLKVITVAYSGESDKEDIKAYFQNRDDYLLTYHKQQNSAFYFENDSVLLKEEKSYFHVCEGRLIAPGNGGIIDHDLYDKTKYMVDAILGEIGAE